MDKKHQCWTFHGNRRLFCCLGTQPRSACFINIPFNKENATVGNGVMVALFMETPEKVDAFYKKAIELGGTDEGGPGFRLAEESKGYYGAYFRDLDGNKLNAFCMVE